MNSEFNNESMLSFEEVEEIIKPHFYCDDKATWKLLVETYRYCVLGKLFNPMPPYINRKWLSPGGFYRGQWLWDTTFVADLLVLLPEYSKDIHEVYLNYRDFQERWNSKNPHYRHGMLPCVEYCEENDFKITYSQIPILAWGLERVYQRNNDIELVRSLLCTLEDFHEWYWRERDLDNIGIVTVGAYSGVIQHARFETFDFECNIDDLKLETHGKADIEDGPWYGNIYLPGMTSYLILGERSLERLANAVGNTDMAKRRKIRADQAVEAVRKYMWDEESGLFLGVKRRTMEKVKVPTIGSWMPLIAGAATDAMAKRMAENILTIDWLTALPVPTVARTHEKWGSGLNGKPLMHELMWRGDVWPVTNYQVASGFAAYGYHDISEMIADKTIENTIKNGINERYHCDTGAALGVKGLGMSCTVISMILEGFSKKYKIERS